MSYVRIGTLDAVGGVIDSRTALIRALPRALIELVAGHSFLQFQTPNTVGRSGSAFEEAI